MSASNPTASVLNYVAVGPTQLCLSNSSRDPSLFAYPCQAMLGKRQVSFFPICPPQTFERIATKALDVYYQVQLRWPSPLFYLEE